MSNIKQIPKLIWFTGLSGAGKTTLSNALKNRFVIHGFSAVVLDGDEVRKTINRDLGFSLNDRTENLRRVAEISRLFLDINIIVLGAFISPLVSDRTMIKNIVGEDNYVEIYLSTPIDICEQRDVKGLYQKARNNEISNFTGLSSVYESPKAPHLSINTAAISITECVDYIFDFLIGKITPSN